MASCDYISREAAIAAVHEHFDEILVYDESGETAANEVEDILLGLTPFIPIISRADVRPVVLCRDCKYSRQPDRSNRAENAACEGVLICRVGFDHVYPIDNGGIFVNGDHYCACGERREHGPEPPEREVEA